MAKAIETLSIKLEFKDAGTQQIISKLSSSLKGMTNVVKGNTSPAISKLRNEILSVGKASTQSISNFRNQANALRALRDEARVGSATFKKLTEDIKKLDAQMAKGQGRRGGGMGARATTQIAGAVVSGGIFGGPEGALGALGGAAFGGVQGAFAGAAIGAQLKGIRDLLSSAADYASQVQKLEIALEGVAGSQDNYNSALQTARQVTEELNVPALDSVRGITRLTAAVSGAGGPIKDAETTFRNVTAAIKATGGSTEDVKGAITAMVQVFSKGKVSAEELSGQLGERLPGAVTLFAKANEMTLPELQKNLKAGTVGLNELMKFIVELGDTYGATASRIADSNAEAGARLSVAVQNMQAEVGAALLPIGAQFQEAFAEFIVSITPFLAKNLPALGKLFLSLSKNIDTVAVAAAAALAVFSAAKIAAIIAGIGGIGKALVLLKAKLVKVALANPFTALALAVGVFAGALYNASKEQARLNKLIKEGTVAEVDAEIARLDKERAVIENRMIAKKKDPFYNYRDQITGTSQRDADEAKLKEIMSQYPTLRERRRVAVYDATQGAGLDPSSFKPFDYGSPTLDDDSDTATGTGTKSTLARRIEAARELERLQIARLNLATAEGKISRLLAKQLNDRERLQEKISKLTKEGSNAEIDRATASAKTTQEAAQQAELQKAIDSLYKQAVKPIQDIVFRVKEQVELDKQRKKLLAEGVNPEIAEEIINITKARDAALRKFDAEILNLEAKAAQADLSEKELQIIEDQIDALRRKKEAITGEASGAIADVRSTQEETSLAKELTKAIEEQEEALKNLIDPINQVKEAAEAMGEAFSVSFKGLIDGSMTGKEAMASFFQSISDHFMDMAAEIAKEAIKLAALKFVQFIFNSFGFGGGGGGGGGTTPPITMPDDPRLTAANGMAFSKNGIVPYAKGGIVSKPTLFQYANGGSGRFGLMGEAGPEAIMPLRRGPDGRLGIESSGGVGNVVVNVDAQGSSVQGDQPNAKALGAALGAAVQAELIKQKRPGGLLS